MIEKIMKAVKSGNKKRGRNITIGITIGLILTGEMGYSEPLEKKAIYDKEIKWLWSLKERKNSVNGSDLDGADAPSSAVTDGIPLHHDPDSSGGYTAILKREWNKKTKKWEVIELQDENRDGIADVYNPEGDFDGDGIKNKDEKNWMLNNNASNTLFSSSNGLGYVDSENIIAAINSGENADKISEYLYHGNKEVFDKGLEMLTENTSLKNITEIENYNNTYNLCSTTYNLKNSTDSEAEIKEKLGVLGEEHLNSYGSFSESETTEIKTKINGYSNSINGQSLETTSKGTPIEEATLINKGTIEGTQSTTQVRGSDRAGQIVLAAWDKNIDQSKLINYGTIKTGSGYEGNFTGQNSGASNSELINYGIIELNVKSNSDTRERGGIGQKLGVRDPNGKYKAYNYGIIKISNRSGGIVTGQETGNVGDNENSQNELYNYGKMILHSYGELTGFKYDYGYSNRLVGQELIFENAAASIGKLYNYGEMELLDEPEKNSGQNVYRYNYGQYAGGLEDSTSVKHEVYNYGTIKIKSKIKGSKINESYSYGQYGYLSGTNSMSNIFNFGTLSVLADSDGVNSYGQFTRIEEWEGDEFYEVNVVIDKNEMYNYGDIEVTGTGESIGQFLKTWSAKEYFKSDMYNYGVIKSEGKGLTAGQFIRGYKGTASNYGQIRVKGTSSDTAGMRIAGGAKGFNYGIIEVDNKGLIPENMGTGMWADGKDSEAFNYGSIIVTGVTGKIENGIDTAYMRVTNGGKVYNYGWLELKDSFDTLTVGGGINSSTESGYKSAGDFDLKGEMQIMAEVGKGDKYFKENFITAGGNGKEGKISGLENLVSSGVYEISIIKRTGENSENIVDLVMNKTKNIEDLEKNRNIGRMVKELKIDSAVYGEDSEFVKNNKEFSTMISRKVSDGETLENLLGLEYANLNGQIVESGKVLLDNQEKVMNTDKTYLSSQFSKENSFDAVIINPQNEIKVGVFYLNSDKDLDVHVPGTYKYDLEGTTLILQNNKNYMIGMNYSKLDYKNRNSNLRKTSIFAGHNYIKPLNDGISEYRNYINGAFTFNAMDRNGKRDNFKSYNLNMKNEYARELDIKGLTYSEFTAGLKTTVFGHEKIKEHGADLTCERNIEIKEKVGISNEINLGVLMNKSYELGENKGKNNFGISTYLGYKKELMSIKDWRDEFSIGTGGYAKYDKPVKEYDAGIGLGVISARYESKDNLSGTLSFSADTLGETMTTFKIEYKF